MYDWSTNEIKIYNEITNLIIFIDLNQLGNYYKKIVIILFLKFYSINCYFSSNTFLFFY